MKLWLRIRSTLLLVLLLLNANPALPSIGNGNIHSSNFRHMNDRHVKNSHRTQKIKSTTLKPKNEYQKINVWDRVRAGLKIPRPAEVMPSPESQGKIAGNPIPLSDTVHDDVLKKTKSSVNPEVSILPIGQMLRLKQALNGSSYISAKKYSLARFKNLHLSDKIADAALADDKKAKMITLQHKQTVVIGGQTRIHSYMDISKRPVVQQDATEELKKLIVGYNDAIGKQLSATRLPEQYPESKPLPDLIEIEKQVAVHERVKTHIDWYAKRTGYLYSVAERARPYLYHIVEELGKNNLPLDLA